MTPEVKASIEKQVSAENGNALAYQAAYSWFRANHFEGFAKFCKNQAIDESKHAQNYVKFAASYGETVAIGANAPDSVPADPVALWHAIADWEVRTEAAIAEIVRIADATGDFAAVEWASRKLDEQRKERKQAQDRAALIASGEDLSLISIKFQERGDIR